MNDDKSFIVLNRKILRWGWYDDINTTRLFLHLLLIANWEDKEWHSEIIKRGQVVTGREKLSKETKLTEQQVRTSLNKLISTNEITIKKTNKYSVITINNYGKYQDYNQQNNQQNNQQITNNQPTNNQQVTTTKQYNNITNISSSSLYDFVEQNFGRTLSPVEYEEIGNWNDNELTKYAIKQAVLNNKCGTKYISRILSAYERENVKTVQQAQERERKYNEAKKNNSRNNRNNYKTSTDRMNEVFERFLAKEDDD